MAYHELAKTISLSQFIDSRVKVQNVILFAGLLGMWHLSFQAFHLYASRRLSSQWSQALDVFKATSVGTFFVLVAALVFHVRIVTAAFLATFWLANTGFTVAKSLALRYLLHWVRLAGRNQRNVLIVGTNARTFALCATDRRQAGTGYRIMGFVDERRDLPHDDYLARHGLVCNLAGFPAFLRTQVVDEVVVALPVKSLFAEAARIVAVCEEQEIIVRCLSTIFHQGRRRSQVDQLHGDPVVTVSSCAAHGFATGVKRALDVCVSALLLVLLAPLAASSCWPSS